MHGVIVMVRGGHEYDGRPIVPLDRAGMRDAARAHRATLAITAVGDHRRFLPAHRRMRAAGAADPARRIPDIAITLSHDLGRIGLLERENVDAAERRACRIWRGAPPRRSRKRCAASGIDAPLYLTQNDGTVMLAGRPRRFPVYSFASGPTNCMRGAAFLSGLKDAMVVDVGGTTTDVGSLKHGFPREANTAVEIGGVRTLFRMPDLLSIGLGGGTRIAPDGSRIGPRSVGFRLLEEGLVFGGDTLTATRHRRRGRPARSWRPKPAEWSVGRVRHEHVGAHGDEMLAEAAGSHEDRGRRRDAVRGGWRRFLVPDRSKAVPTSSTCRITRSPTRSARPSRR